MIKGYTKKEFNTRSIFFKEKLNINCFSVEPYNNFSRGCYFVYIIFGLNIS